MVGREKRDTWWLPTAQHISIKAHILKSIDDRREKKRDMVGILMYCLTHGTIQ